LITCGYSAYAEQHQDVCIEAIQKLPPALRERIYVIVPMQYGRLDDHAYIEKVSTLAAHCDFPCEILREYVPFEKSVKLAIATDIYLHVRDTDAFSNALKEHVFAGSFVIKGDWLNYIELAEMRAPIQSISSLDDLEDVLYSTLKEYRISQEIKLFNPIYEMYSTASINSQWQDVLNRVLADEEVRV
jgi:hypothetical protein